MTNDFYTPCRAQELIKRLNQAQEMVLYYENKGWHTASENWCKHCDDLMMQIERICIKLETFANRKEGRVKDIMTLQIKSIRSAAGLE